MYKCTYPSATAILLYSTPPPPSAMYKFDSWTNRQQALREKEEAESAAAARSAAAAAAAALKSNCTYEKEERARKMTTTAKREHRKVSFKNEPELPDTENRRCPQAQTDTNNNRSSRSSLRENATFCVSCSNSTPSAYESFQGGTNIKLSASIQHKMSSSIPPALTSISLTTLHRPVFPCTSPRSVFYLQYLSSVLRSNS